MTDEFRRDIVVQEINKATFANRNGNTNQTYPGKVRYIKNSLLNENEKEAAIQQITLKKDHKNFFELKEKESSCKMCGRAGFTILNCEHCVRDTLQSRFTSWTSGNDIIDNAIKEAQSRCPIPGYLSEWIEYKDLEDVKYMTEGGCAKIWTAIWKKGFIMSFDKDQRQFIRSGPLSVILKQLANSKKATEEFLRELTLHLSLQSKGYRVLKCWGVTRDPVTGDYMLVLQHLDTDLRSFIEKNYSSLQWKEVYHMFWRILESINNLHKGNIAHKDLHSGNVLLESVWEIADFGLCGPADKPQSKIYGNIPYMAPEIIRGGAYALSADIYSVGMLMYEVTAGHRPFLGLDSGVDLALKICDGLRPTLPDGIPESYKNLMIRCWDADPSKRPTAYELLQYFFEATSNNSESSFVSSPGTSRRDTSSIPSSKSSLFRYGNLSEPRNATQDEQRVFDEEYRRMNGFDMEITQEIDEFKNDTSPS